MKRHESTDTAAAVVAALLLAGIVAICLTVSGLYAEWIYGDWHCGMPGVQCRIEKGVKP
jgi:hypothetical protein